MIFLCVITYSLPEIGDIKEMMTMAKKGLWNPLFYSTDRLLNSLKHITYFFKHSNNVVSIIGFIKYVVEKTEFCKSTRVDY